MSLARPSPVAQAIETALAWALGALWLAPLLYALWTAFHPPDFATRFDLLAPLTLDNFRRAWEAAPFARYFLNTAVIVAIVVASQIVLGTLAAFALARFAFRGRDVLFALILLQLMIAPEILAVANYRTMRSIGAVDTIWGIVLPYLTSAFGIFLLRQTFRTVPQDIEDAARIEGCGTLGVLWRVYVPAARAVYLAYGLVQASWHWNNFLWPLIITNSVEQRPLTVGLSVFASVDQGIDWSVITAATLMTSGPLLVAFLVFQRRFVQSFASAGLR